MQSEEDEQLPEDDQLDPEQYDMPFNNRRSSEAPYYTCTQEKLLEKIHLEAEQYRQLTGFDEKWTLVLFYICQFKLDILQELFGSPTPIREIIKYNQEYFFSQSLLGSGACAVCCEEGELLLNSCTHIFCFNCWESRLELGLFDRNSYDLFPLCMDEGCASRMHYDLIRHILSKNQKMKEQFERLLCLKYSQMSMNVRICPECNRIIFIRGYYEKVLLCQCGKKICRNCGRETHLPLNCVDSDNWNQLATQKEDQWINSIVTKKCPLCKEPIEKNEGCNHMTCRCKYQFCWVCDKVWQGHTNQGCSNISVHEKNMKIEQEKRKQDEEFYNIRFQEAKAVIDRCLLILKRINSLDLKDLRDSLFTVSRIYINESEILSEVILELKKCQSFVKWTAVYRFFEREDFKLYTDQADLMDKMCGEIDEAITFLHKMTTNKEQVTNFLDLQKKLNYLKNQMETKYNTIERDRGFK